MSSLEDLLDQYAAAAVAAPGDGERARIEAALWQTFGVEQTVLVLDMAGFSQTVQRHGLVHYLAMVQRMRRTMAPLVERHGGAMVKFSADNGFARFPEVADAVAAGLAINEALALANRQLPDSQAIHVAIGIDHGRFLLIDDRDYFGEPVNLACKLGEDIAGPGEILVTARAMDRVTAPAFVVEPVTFLVSGVEIAACRVTGRQAGC